VKLSVKALEQMSQFDAITSMANPATNLVSELGIIGVEIDASVLGVASGLRDPYGIIVAARAAGARTEVGVQPSDVIRSVNNVKMTSLAQLRSAIRQLKPGTAVTMQVQRDGRLIYVSFTLE
jgi:S1-C subfamily serine protease